LEGDVASNTNAQLDARGEVIFPSVSVLRLEFEIPKRCKNKLYAAAGSSADLLLQMEKELAERLGHIEGEEEVRLIGFIIDG